MAIAQGPWNLEHLGILLLSKKKLVVDGCQQCAAGVGAHARIRLDGDASTAARP